MRPRVAAVLEIAAGRLPRQHPAGGTAALSLTCRALGGIMWVTFGHLRPSGHIMPDHASDRGAVFLVLAPHDHLAYQADARVIGAGRRCIVMQDGQPLSGLKPGLPDRRQREGLLLPAHVAADMRAGPRDQVAARAARERTIWRASWRLCGPLDCCVSHT